MRLPLRFRPVLALTLIALAAPGWVAAQTGATLAVQAPAQPPSVDAAFTTPVTISGAADLLGFQFDIGFDPALLAVESVELGPFLRSAQPLGPDLAAASAGVVTFGGYTLTDAGSSGASGDGVLAIITWRALKPGASSISLRRTLLAGPSGTPLPVAVSHSLAVTIETGARFPWFWAGLAAGVILLGWLWLWRRR